jgi:D-alanine-D-alanine ligase
MTEKMKINVGVIFGGRSVEHEVSIISAHQAMAALDTEKYRAVPIYIAKDGRWFGGEALLDLNAYKDMPKLLAAAIPIELSVNFGVKQIFSRPPGRFKKPWQERIDVVLPVGHGTSVEDGCLQGLLETSGIPYAGPAVLGSAVGMDKIMMKAVLKDAGLPIVEGRFFAAYQWEADAAGVIAEIEGALAYPLVVKPGNLGSSIGVSRVANREELEAAIELAVSFSRRVIVEKAVTPLREINCAVLGAPGNLETSACEEPVSGEEILSFSDKYLNAGNKGMSSAKRRILPDDDATVRQVKVYAKAAFSALDCRGVCRVDFLINSFSGEIFVNELNTIPGSLSFYLFEPAGLPFGDLLDRLIRLALEQKRIQDKLTTVYASNILAQGGFKGKK